MSSSLCSLSSFTKSCSRLLLLLLVTFSCLIINKNSNVCDAQRSAVSVRKKPITAGSSSIAKTLSSVFTKGREIDDIGSSSSSSSIVGGDGSGNNDNHQHDHVDLSFEEIYVAIENKHQHQEDKILLNGSIRGTANSGRMLAIMGPSGSGKTTLLHALAGRVKQQRSGNKQMNVHGKRYINGNEISGMTNIPNMAFVEQETNFFPYMTVRETIDFRVALALGSRNPPQEKRSKADIVEKLITQLGLTNAADTIVGNNKIRGISGGEKKRLSIAVEMIDSPSIIFLDEPTSGLDSTAAASIINNLQDLAKTMGKTIIAVIHQPSHNVFMQFDDLLLLSNGGKQLYFGETKNVRHYMESNGYSTVHKDVGTAEHVLNCISNLRMSGETEQDTNNRIDDLAKIALDDYKKKKKNLLPSSNSSNLSSTGVTGSSVKRREGPKANILIQTRLLLIRSMKDILRGKGALLIKGFQQLTVGLIYGGIFNLGDNQASVQDRFGLISLLSIGASNLAVATTIRSFPKEKTIVSNEIASNMYRTFPYFLGKAISEIPQIVFFNTVLGCTVYKLSGMNRAKNKFRNFIALLSTHGFASQSLGLMLGAISSSQEVALALFPAVLILNIIFDGRNISIENTPKALRFITNIGLIRWGFEGMCINEFNGLTFSAKGPPRGPITKTGNDALSRLGMGNPAINNLGNVFKAQGILSGSCWMLSYLGISLTRQKFVVMKMPKQ